MCFSQRDLLFLGPVSSEVSDDFLRSLLLRTGFPMIFELGAVQQGNSTWNGATSRVTAPQDDTFKDAPNARMRIVDKNVDKAQADRTHVSRVALFLPPLNIYESLRIPSVILNRVAHFYTSLMDTDRMKFHIELDWHFGRQGRLGWSFGVHFGGMRSRMCFKKQAWSNVSSARVTAAPSRVKVLPPPCGWVGAMPAA